MGVICNDYDRLEAELFACSKISLKMRTQISSFLLPLGVTVGMKRTTWVESTSKREVIMVQRSAKQRNRRGLQRWGCVGFLACMVLLGTACGDDDENADNDNKKTQDKDAGADDTDTNSDIENVCSFDPDLAEGDANELFDWPHVPTFDIYLPVEHWEQLQIDARDEAYVEAEACFEGRGIGTVGLRFKGSYGSLYNCFNEKDENTCRKLAIKLKFSKYDKEGRFFGMKRLNFQSNRYDDSYIREKLSYEMYRAADIVAPRAWWANLRVNDELIGLYGMVEQIDGRFTDDRWEEAGDGNLYKEVWPVTTDEDFITERLKTNDDEPDIEAFVDFSQAMLDAEPDALRETLGEYMDLDYLARYMVVDDAIANFDGITAYYTDKDITMAGNHNFYIYEEAADAFTLIPWDLESTFNTSSFGYVPHWTHLPDDCQVTYSAWGETDLQVIAPACDIVFQAMRQDLSAYQAFGETFLEDTFTKKKIMDMIDEYADFIEEDVDNDPNGPGLDAFKSDVGTLKNNVPTLISRLGYLLDGEEIIPLEIDADSVVDFETQTDIGAVIGTGLWINPSSTPDVYINDETPMEGNRSLHIGFEYRDGEKGWDQWFEYMVRITGPARDLREFKGMRFMARADQPRTLRIELDSTFASAKDNWLRPGWDIDIDEEAGEFEVLVDDTDFPWWAASQGIEPASEVKDVLSATTGIIFFPQCNGVGASGFLPDDTTDKGFVEIDHIEFF